MLKVFCFALLNLSPESLGVNLHDLRAHGAPRFVFLRFGFFLLISSKLSRESPGVTLRDFGSHEATRFVFLSFVFFVESLSGLSGCRLARF